MDDTGEVPDDQVWDHLRAGLDPDARIGRDLIDSLEKNLLGNGDFMTTIAKMVGAITAIEKRVLELERAQS